jgi:hypothetical protein
MRDIVDDEQRSYRVLGAQRAAHKPTRPVRERRKAWLPFALRQRSPRDFWHGLLASGS